MVYKQEVLLAYRKKAKEGVLSDELTNPTRAKLKEECLRIYRSGPLADRDREILKVFLGIRREVEDYSQSIIDYDDGRFRPLDNFLKGETDDPHVRTVDLLAWLIDFPERPSSAWRPKTEANPPSSILLNFIKKQFEKLRSGKKVQVAFAVFAIITLTSGIIFIYPITFGKQCMYWTGNNYEATGCDIIIGDTPIIALNKDKLAHLQRITKPDTLTLKDVGKAWYIKITLDSAEFYTDSGVYPLDARKRLRPVSNFIIEKYVLSKKLAKTKQN
ncbi:hypothetical protein [Pedobacter boryungensis]|uniref:Uncharacterized protein n=1 Tax=Pedobacter boryungensis TaxID=869962 RepID=A0ABX2DBX5_9SPHI|nr:hypothetical protein [Pedobacter boryungensis]NQX31577.1 hypothetical protein [Pedobacter boryungensis]